MTAVASARPERFSIGRVFGSTFSVIGRSFGPLAAIVGLFSTLPALLYNFWSLSQVARMANPADVAAFESMASYSIISVVAGLVLLILAFLAQAALVRATVEDLNGKRPAVGDCMQIALASFLPTLGIGLVVFLAMILAGIVMVIVAAVIPVVGWLVGLIAVLIPAAMWLLGIAVSIPVAVQERLGVFDSISRSRVLTKGSRWPIFWLFLIIGLVAMVLQVGFSLLFGFAVAASGSITGTGVVVGAIGSSLLSTIFSTVISVAIALTYVELRQVKEGTSVDELAEIFS